MQTEQIIVSRKRISHIEYIVLRIFLRVARITHNYCLLKAILGFALSVFQTVILAISR